MLLMFGSNIAFINYENQNQVRRIDLADMREDSLELPSVISNIAIDKRTNTMFCLSRVVDRIYRVKVDVTQMVKIGFTKFADSSGSPPSPDGWKYSLLESNDAFLVTVGDKSLNPDTHANKVLVLDAELGEVASKEFQVKGKAGWLEKAILISHRSRTFVAAVSLQSMNFYLWELVEGERGSKARLVDCFTAQRAHNRSAGSSSLHQRPRL